MGGRRGTKGGGVSEGWCWQWWPSWDLELRLHIGEDLKTRNRCNPIVGGIQGTQDFLGQSWSPPVERTGGWGSRLAWDQVLHTCVPLRHGGKSHVLLHHCTQRSGLHRPCSPCVDPGSKSRSTQELFISPKVKMRPGALRWG